ncbi:hypothetical protein [Lachnoanaerobaculum gingivalis]|uniref:hypothetical protein n=1 Tax=Lachnoanaerobaculum gingivalis TaxID=2490855 RepID=UPI0028D76769|nr:hypothetical protein [Lachnoanaerobaculum gingivalis]
MDNYFEWRDDLKENMQEVANRTLEQIQENIVLSEVKNRHEGYGISAEHYIIMQKAFKSVKTDMDDFLKLLPVEDKNALNTVSSLYNSAIDMGVAAMEFAAQCKRILADLYDKEKSPLEQYIDEMESGAEDFEDVGEN